MARPMLLSYARTVPHGYGPPGSRVVPRPSRRMEVATSTSSFSKHTATQTLCDKFAAGTAPWANIEERFPTRLHCAWSPSSILTKHWVLGWRFWSNYTTWLSCFIEQRLQSTSHLLGFGLGIRCLWTSGIDTRRRSSQTSSQHIDVAASQPLSTYASTPLPP